MKISKPKKSNILILMVDQLSGEFFTDGPTDFLHAPNLKKLAQRSTKFNNTYCASPLCSPARASFMTGNLPSLTGVYDNAAEFPSSLPTFAHSLRSLGYRTILSGKMHFVGADQLHGYEERLTTDIYPADFGWTPDWGKPEERVDWWYHNMGSVTGAGVAATSNQLEYDDEVAYHAKLKLHQLARQKQDGKPFCLTVSFTHPHDPYVTRQKYWDLYDDVELPELNVKKIKFEQQDPHSQRLYKAVDHENFEETDQDVAAARHAYFANISYLDEKIGEILAVLEECEFGDDTIIVFCADHGDMLGERGLWYKMSFFEGSMKVPFFVSTPRSLEAAEPNLAQSINQPVSIMDLAPTLVEMAGGQPSDCAAVDGRSLVSAINANQSPELPVYAEYVGEGSIDPMLMIRHQQWKFNFCEVDPPQLFNLQDDPFEQTNLADDPAHKDLVQEFTLKIHQRWDVARFRQQVTSSQQQRLAVYDGLTKGKFSAWDFQPIQDASNRYMRNHLDLNQVEAGSRFPKLEDQNKTS
jgi:choline-sulfatase